MSANIRRLLLLFLFSLSASYTRAQSKAEILERTLAYCSNLKKIPKDSLGKYARKSVALATELNDRSSMARAYAYLARYYLNSSLKDSALYALEQVDRYYGGDRPSQLAKNTADMMRGSLLVKSNRHKEAISWYFSIIDRVKQNDTFNYLGILHGIGWANMELGRFTEAKRWFLKVVQFPDTVYEASRVITLCNLAATYAALHQSDSAEYFLNRAIVLSRKHHSLIAEANALNIYGDLLMEQQRFSEAERKILEAIAIRKQIGDPFYIISDMAQLSALYGRWDQYDKGIKWGEAARSLADSTGIDAKLPMIYEALRRNYFGRGNFKRSAQMADLLLTLKDSLNNRASAESLAEMEVRYESAKKEHRIRVQSYEIGRKNILIYASIAASLLLCLLFFVLWRLNRQRQRQRLQAIRLAEQERAARAIMAAEERERQKLSELLHDGLGQQLSALNMNLQAFGTESGQRGIVLKNMQSLTKNAIEQVRDISHGLSPRNVLHRGLIATLGQLGQQLPANGVRLQLELPQEVNQLPPEIQLSLFRVIQEALNNVSKHARASQMRVRAYTQGSNWYWEIEDDGVGFDPHTPSEGIGLVHIDARIRLLNGHMQLHAAADEGTRMYIVFPKPQQHESVT